MTPTPQIPAGEDCMLVDTSQAKATGKHTPGPWRDALTCGAIVSDTAIEHGPHGCDCVQYYGGHLIAESFAACNRPLIAAAPELLEALEGLMALESRGRIMPIGKEWDAARAVIAKATGVQA